MHRFPNIMAAKTTICSYLSHLFVLFLIIAVLGFFSLPKVAEAQTTTVAQTTVAQVTNASTAPPVTTTTEPPPTTTTLPPTTTIVPNEPRTVIGETVVGQCLCDLTGNQCDVNCCCDTDCSEEERTSVFVCDQRSVIKDDKLCYQEEFFLFTNSPARTEKTNDGLFCIFYDNNKDRNYYLDPDFVQDFPSFNDYLNKYSVPSLQQPEIAEEEQYTLQSIYTAGDPIRTVFPDESVGKMVLPTPLGSNECNDQNTMAYLTESSTQCSRDVTLDAATCTSTNSLDALSYFDGFRVVKTPGLFGYVQNGTFVGITTTPAPVTTVTTVPPTTGPTVTGVTTQSTTTTTTQAPTTVDTGAVQNLFNNPYTVPIDSTTLQHLCKLDDGTLTTCTFTNPPQPTSSGDNCSNVVLEAQYTFITNGSFGISSVLVRFVFGNVTQANFPLTQSFSVSFNSATDSNETMARSGNPGYLFGKYLLYGELNQTSTVDGLVQTIITDPDPNRGLTVVRATASGDCGMSVADRVPVRFGQNMRTGCLIRFNAGTSGADCAALQRDIVNTLEGPANAPVFDTLTNSWIDNKRYVATFGNTPDYKVGDWVRIIVDGRLMPVTADTVPTGTCRLRMGMHIQVLYANVGALANPQPKIVGVAMLYDSVKDVPTRCSGAFCQDATNTAEQAFEVSQTVSFVDVSQPAVKYQGEAPVFIARVPNDFFYPFLYYTNSAVRVSSHVTISTLISLLAVVFVKYNVYMS